MLIDELHGLIILAITERACCMQSKLCIIELWDSSLVGCLLFSLEVGQCVEESVDFGLVQYIREDSKIDTESLEAFEAHEHL